MSDKKKTVQDYIDETAKKAAHEVVRTQRRERNINLYRATERLLRSYPRFKRWEEHPEEYGFFPVGKSKDISVAPPPGLGVRDRVELNEEFIASRKASFGRSMNHYYDIKAVVEQFQDRPEFIVIRMYYFNEDATGEPRGDTKPYTFAEIAEELETVGIQRSEKILRKWRTKIVQDMTVLMWGADGALSVEAREPKQGQKEIGTEGAKADE